MDIGLREWLIVIGLIVIAGILFDGWRRMRGGKGKLKFKLDRSFANLPDDDGDSAELLGPARVVEHREPSFDEQDLPSVSAREAKERKGGKRQEEPRQGDLDLDEGLALEHRHESMAGNGEILFSMANAVKPGTFDLDDIDNFSTRAVSFFLGLPGPRHPKQAFDVMVAAARKLAHELNGELKDEQRSVLTAQTIEHYRQRIIDHERRSLMQKR